MKKLVLLVLVILSLIKVNASVAQDFLVPCESQRWPSNLIPPPPPSSEWKRSKYKASPQQMFHLLYNKYMLPQHWSYLARPSFRGEYSLSFNDSCITYVQNDKDSFQKLLNKKGTKLLHPEYIHRYDMEVPDSVTKVLRVMINAAINTSSYLFEHPGEDGTLYYFEGINSAYCWSPSGRCGELVKIMDDCCEAVKQSSLDSLKAIIPRMHNMITRFRRDYPSSIFEPKPIDYYLYDSSGSDPLHSEISFEIALNMCFPNDSVRDIYLETYRDQLAEMVKILYSEAYFSAVEDESVNIIIDDKNPFVLTKQNQGLYHYNMTIDTAHSSPEILTNILRSIRNYEPGLYLYHIENGTWETLGMGRRVKGTGSLTHLTKL